MLKSLTDFSVPTSKKDIKHRDIPGGRMMRWMQFLCAAAILTALPVVHAAEDLRDEAAEVTSTGDLAVTDSVDQEYEQFLTRVASSDTSGTPVPALLEEDRVVRGQSAGWVSSIARFGWWGISTDGSQTRTGEWQDLSSGPFFDVDGLWSNGDSTVDYFITGNDNETSTTGWYFYRRGFSANVDYQRFLHRLDHDPLWNFFDFTETGDPTPSGQPVSWVKEDLNTGEDYAIRVREFDARFQGNLTQNVRWGFDVWGLEKSGERQGRAVSQCYDHPEVANTTRTCHVLSQRQAIDWQTFEIKPMLEGNFGPVTVAYSRPMRWFNQNDQIITRLYNPFGAGSSQLGNGPTDGVFPYAWVPDNFTQFDKLQVGVDLTDTAQLYGLIFFGNSENKRRDTYRVYRGFDLRLSDRPTRAFSWTTYAKWNEQDNRNPPFQLPEEIEFPTPTEEIVRHPIDYNRTKVGINGRYRVGQRAWSTTGLAITGGYEFAAIDRDFAVWEGEGDFEGVVWDQNYTRSNLFHAGLQQRWSRYLDNFVRVKTIQIKNPLYGIRQSSGDLNSNLPEHVDIVEFGGTWYPSDNFLLSGQVGIENTNQNSEVAQFAEDNYPIVFSAWYAPTCRWTMSGGLAFYSNWIDQNITLGDNYGFAEPIEPVTLPWSYNGRSTVVDLGTSYAWTDRVTLQGFVQWVRGSNYFDTPPAFPLPEDPTQIVQWTDLPIYSSVIVETVRLGGGFDYLINDRISTYFRYNLFDWEGKTLTEDPNSGTAHMFLAGVSAVF